ncbi:MAG: hypothetical protein DYG89_48215 [Caldilinea sp. CFX5]|nr:hypothetical protein [Caldilinea sp. CFX5]
MQEAFDWVKPSLLWARNGQDRDQGAFYRPALLRYASDNFVEDFLADAGAASPQALRTRLLVGNHGQPLKFYQPAHGLFYLVCATLSCRQPGLPDRQIRLAAGEQVYYVLRRRRGDSEYGWLPEGETQGWQLVTDNRRTVLPGEERHPMFRAITASGRDLLYAYVPVASRSSAPGNLAEVPDDVIGEPAPPEDLRRFELDGRFLSQVDPATGASLQQAAAVDPALAKRLSVYLLIDLWEYFDRYLPNTAARLAGTATAPVTDEEAALLTFLETADALSGATALRVLLEEIAPQRAALDALGEAALPPPFDGDDYNLAGRTFNRGEWETKVQAALDKVDEEAERAKPQTVLPQVQPATGEHYVIRCVYERAQCDPIQQWVSQPSAPFAPAGLYDPEAPARQINIALPDDISLGTLRKFQKGATFIMSQALRNKIKQIPVVKMTDDDADVSGISLSYICSFSIPIITICAFILLLIIVIVLNFVFWWLPFLKICFPIPKATE